MHATIVVLLRTYAINNFLYHHQSSISATRGHLLAVPARSFGDVVFGASMAPKGAKGAKKVAARKQGPKQSQPVADHREFNKKNELLSNPSLFSKIHMRVPR